METLKAMNIEPFYQWIDGSFVSKKVLPKDIDIVTFLPFKEYEQNEVKIRDIKKRYPFLDCYFVKDYPENHLNHFITLFDKTEWLYLFSTDRKKNPKGFVKINF